MFCTIIFFIGVGKFMAEFIILALFAVVSILWLWLCVKKYSWFTVKGLLLHMLLFGVISVVIMWIAAQLVFLPFRYPRQGLQERHRYP